MDKSDLITLAELVRDEILTTGGIILAGHFYSTDEGVMPFTGLCAPAVDKLIQLAPVDLRIHRLSLRLQSEDRLNVPQHILAEALINGAYQIDPTIEQYIPGAQMVYGPNEKYPLSIRSVKQF